MRRLALLVACLVLSAGCTATPVTSPTASSAAGPVLAPERVVADWVAAVAGGDPEATTARVDEVALVLMIGAENPMPVADLAAMVSGGVGDATRRSYWDTFATDFAAFSGVPLADVIVGSAETFVVDGTSFAAVAISGGERSSEIVCRRGEDGEWKVDLMATIGPTLVRSLRTLVVGLPEGDDGATVRDAFVDRVASLRAGSERIPGAALPEAFRIELDALAGFLESLR